MMLSIARALRLVTMIGGTAALAGCCGYLVSCPTTQTGFESAGYALASLGSARDQAAGLLETSNTAFRPDVAQSLAARYAAFGDASMVWQKDAAAVLRSSAAFSEQRNNEELAAMSTAARNYALAVESAAGNPQNFAVTYARFHNAVIDKRDGLASDRRLRARSFADDVAPGRR